MNWLRNPGRIAGLVYFSMVFTGPLTLMYIPKKLFVTGNAAATAQNIAAHEMLFRIGMYVDLIEGLQALAFAGVVWLLFRHADRVQAALVVLLGGLPVMTIYFLNDVNYAGALLFARGGGSSLSAFTMPQRDALVLLFVRLHHYGVLVNGVFWGLWLIPLAIVLYKSHSIPRLLAALLMLNAIPYLAWSFAGIVFPDYEQTVWNSLFPLTFGEIAVMLWLLVRGSVATRLSASTV